MQVTKGMRPICLHGGTVVADNSTSCLCPIRYTGDHCESAICLNGGLSYGIGKCKCPQLFVGEICENPVCLNGGLPLSDGCICPDKNFTGRHCESVLCRSGGTPRSNGFCDCPPLHDGRFCEQFCPGGTIAADGSCEFVICSNGGTPRWNEPSCLCPPDFSGRFCQLPQCGSNGKPAEDNSRCECLYPYVSGSHCEVLSCANGVLPIEGRCDCPLWLQGNFCEKISNDVYLMAGIFGFIPLLFLLLFCSLKFNRTLKRAGRQPFQPGVNGLLSSIADTNGANATRTSRASLARIPELNLDFYEDDANLSTSHGISPILPEYEEAVVYFPHPQTLYHHMWRHQPPPSYEAVAKGHLSRGKLAGSYTFDSAVSLYCQRTRGIPNSIST